MSVGDQSRAQKISPNHAIDRDACISCGACVRVCTAGVYELRDNRIEMSNKHLDCMVCGHCMAVCPTKAVFVADNSYTDARDAHLTDANWDAFRDILASRHSIRGFKPDPVPHDLIEKIVAAGSEAPMAIPPHTTSVIVIEGRDKVAEISKLTFETYAKFGKTLGNPISRLFMMAMMDKRTRKVIREFVEPFIIPNMVEAKKAGFDAASYGAPTLIALHGPTEGFAVEENIGIVAEYMHLAATSLGLGSIIIGLIPPALNFAPKELKAKYGLPEGHSVYLCVLVGYPVNKYIRSVPRKFVGVQWK